MICVPIFGKDLKEISSRARIAAKCCDLLELRLDLVEGLDKGLLKQVMQEMPLPVIATNRASWEGGAFNGSEDDRIDLLEDALEFGASYIDIEFATQGSHKERLKEAVDKAGATLILSHHDFQGTPSFSQLEELFLKMTREGEAIIKIVTFAQDPWNFLEIFRLYPIAKEKGRPLIAFCMGKYGCISRTICLKLGAYLTFASLETGLDSAPGQIPANKLTEILTLLDSACQL